MFDWFFKLFQSNYKSRLDEYISIHNPTNVGDVERLMLQYNRKRDNLWI